MGTETAALCQSEVWCVQNPQWSPDHSRVVFTRSESEARSAWVMSDDGAGVSYVGDRDGREGIFTVTPATGKIEPVATVKEGNARFHEPAWSSTGLLAFSYDDDRSIAPEGDAGTITMPDWS